MPQQKRKVIISLFNEGYNEQIEQLFKSAGVPFIKKRSTYTLEYDNGIMPRYRFLKKYMSNRCFAASAMIERDIKNKGYVPPEIKKSDLFYYQFSVPEKLKAAPSTIYNIDIKSAYAQALFNNFVIEQDTKNMIASLEKEERLAAIGKLASKKTVYRFEANGELIEDETNPATEINVNSGFFFFCVLEVQKKMREIMLRLKDDFLFYWVDGLYFKNKENAQSIIDYLKSENYECSFKALHKFRVLENKEKYKLFFFEDKDPNEKVFRVPKEDLSINIKIAESLKMFEA